MIILEHFNDVGLRELGEAYGAKTFNYIIIIPNCKLYIFNIQFGLGNTWLRIFILSFLRYLREPYIIIICFIKAP